MDTGSKTKQTKENKIWKQTTTEKETFGPSSLASKSNDTKRTCMCNSHFRGHDRCLVEQCIQIKMHRESAKMVK